MCPCLSRTKPDPAPSQGLAAGLSALPGDVDAAYVTACDVPLLVPGFVGRLFELLEGTSDKIAVPKVDGYHHPLSAVYSPSVLSDIEQLLSEDRLRPFFLFEQVPTREVTADEWADVDLDSRTLDNLNRPEDYFRAAEAAGYDVPEAIRRELT